MVRVRHIGRAMVRRHVGKARVGDAAARDHAATSVLRLDEPTPSPVFVDASGRRHRRLRRFALVAVLTALLGLLLLWLSQLGDPVRPTPVRPCLTVSAGSADPGAAPDAGVPCEDR